MAIIASLSLVKFNYEKGYLLLNIINISQMINKLIKSSLKSLRTHSRHQVLYQFQQISQNSTTKSQRRPYIPRFYLNSKLDSLSSNCNQIISQMLQKPKNVDRHEQLLSHFLDLHASNNKEKSAKDLLCLLVAITLHNQPRLNYFIKFLLEHLMRNKVEETAMDQVQLSCFIGIMRNGLNTSIQRAKYQAMVFTYLKIMQSHFQIIFISDYYSLIHLLIEQRKNRFYFSKFAIRFQQFLINTYIVPWLEGKTDSRIQKFMANSNNTLSLLKLMNEYNCTAQNGLIVYNYVQKFYLKQKIFKENVDLDFITRVFRHFPNRTKAADGTLHKTKIFNEISAFIQNKKLSLFVLNPEVLPFKLCNAILHHFFYQFWLSLTFSQINGLIFLQKGQLKEPPSLPPLFWQLYAKYTQQINSQAIIRDSIKRIYPSKFINTQLKDIIQTRQPTSETQMMIRMEIVLMNLKLAYKKQVYAESRYIDFLLDDNIVLQLDGLLHYDPHLFQHNDKTTYRNLHLLFAGYRLIVINIHEYNMHREVPQLTQLFKQKMGILKQYDCAAVI